MRGRSIITKQLPLAIGLLALATVGLAGEPKVNEGWPDNPGYCIDDDCYQYGQYIGKRTELGQPACLATMEAAMKSIEPFLYSAFKRNGDRKTDHSHMTIEQRDKREYVFDQWTAAKRCWRTP